MFIKENKMNDGKNLIFKKIDIITNKLLDFFMIMGVLAIGLILLLQVASRYVLRYPFPWPEEMAGFIFVWLIFIGAKSVYDENKLINVSLLRNKLPTLLQKVLCIAMDIIVVICLIIMVIQGVNAVLLTVPRKTAALQISIAYINAALPIGFFLLSLSYVKNILKNIKEIKILLSK